MRAASVKSTSTRVSTVRPSSRPLPEASHPNCPRANPSATKTIGGETTPRSILRETAPKATRATANDARTEGSIEGLGTG